MIQEIFWIIGIYGFSMIAVHIAHLWLRLQNNNQGNTHQQHILVSNQNQLQIEWYIRSLLFMAWMKGKSVHITIMDEGSTDETLAIANKLSIRYFPDVRILNTIHSSSECKTLLLNEKIIITDLRTNCAFQPAGQEN